MTEITSTTPTPQTETLLDNEFSLYTKTLTFNVIGRYDPKIDRLLYHTSHCQLYKFNESQEWEKMEYSGVLAVYSRKTSEENIGTVNVDDIYNHGLIILNRTSPENFSVGLLSNEESRKLGISEIKTEYQTDYIIIKNLAGDIFGFWIHEEKDRNSVFSLIKAIIE